MSGGTVIGILVVLFVVLFAWQFGATKKALVTTTVQSRRSPEEAFGLIQEAFSGARSALWTRAAGPGDINMRRRGKGGGIVMSIEVASTGNGGSSVAMWASTYNEYLFVLANFAGSVNSRKRAIAELL